MPPAIAVFRAIIPEIQSAIKIGDGARIQLDVSDEDMNQVMALIERGRHRVLHVVITEEEGVMDVEG